MRKSKLIQMTLAAELCGTCDRFMLNTSRKSSSKLRAVFPIYYKRNLEAQMKEQNLFFNSYIKDKDGNWICEVCAEEGKSTFICALCKEERLSDQKHDSFGDPPEYLCKNCYETVSAKIWEEKSEELYERHKYDFE